MITTLETIRIREYFPGMSPWDGKNPQMGNFYKDCMTTRSILFLSSLIPTISLGYSVVRTLTGFNESLRSLVADTTF